jgi:uncharacterized membrane protein YfcA
MQSSTTTLLIFLAVVISCLGFIAWAVKTRRVNRWHGALIGLAVTAILGAILGQLYVDSSDRESVRQSIRVWDRTHPGVPRRHYE